MIGIGKSLAAAFAGGDMADRATALRRSFAVGAAVFAGAFAFCLLYSASFAVMGVRVQALEDFVIAEFKWLILFHQAKILVSYVLLGGTAGASAGFCLHLWCVITGRRLAARRAVAPVALYCAAFVAAFLLADMRIHPALYNEHFYARGGIAAGFQVLVTHGLPGGLVTAFRAAVCAVCIPLAVALTARLAGALARATKRLPRRARSAVALVAAAALLFTFVTLNRNEGPNVIILAADSFRYDRVSALGGRPGLTPNIDALAAQGTSLDDFHIQLPRTFPSWYCLLSGRYPAQHGIRHMFPSRAELASARPALPEVLKKNGYVRSAVADYAGDIFSRMDCFDRLRAPRFNFTTLIRQRGLEVHFLLLPFLQNAAGRYLFPETRAFAQNSDPSFLVADIKSEIDALAGKKRFFLTVFFSATHFPYAAPYPYYAKYTDPGYRGEYRYLKINNPLRETLITTEDRRQIEALFDGACSAVDDAVGEVIAHLKRRGLYDNSIVVFTADHGENLYDHGLDLGHGEHFRGEYATHVPMIVKFHDGYAPRVRVSRYDGVVQQIDFAPTLLDVMGLDGAAGMAGVSYRRALEGKTVRIPRTAYAETGIWFVAEGGQFFQRMRILYPDVSVLCGLEEPEMDVVLKDEYRDLITIAKHRAVFDETHKLIYMPTRDGVRYELLRRGDASYTNRARSEPEDFARLERRLRETVTRHENVSVVNGFFIPQRER
jgi:arylsulfatase A-like enzyme